MVKALATLRFGNTLLSELETEKGLLLLGDFTVPFADDFTELPDSEEVVEEDDFVSTPIFWQVRANRRRGFCPRKSFYKAQRKTDQAGVLIIRTGRLKLLFYSCTIEI